MTAHLDDELLSAHLDGALDDAERARVEEHLGACAGCLHREALMRGTTRAVAGLPEELTPRLLDLSFLPPTPGRVLDLPRSRRWRPPPWAVPTAAAAAVLLVAGSLATVALRHPGGGAATALTTTGRRTEGTAGGLAGPGAASPSAARGADAAAPGAAAPYLAAAPAGPGTKTFAAEGGAAVSVGTSAANPAHGKPVTVTLTVRAGSAALDARAFAVTARNASGSMPIFGAGPQAIPAGGTTTVYGSWTAGELGGGPAPGDYLLEARVSLAAGGDLVSTLAVRVS
jgi:anti-sigma factor RsiW